MLEVKIKKVHPDAVIPKYAYEDDAGMDIIAVGMKEKLDQYIEYSTGLTFEIPKEYCLLVFPRSSISNKSLIMANGVGLNDSNYRGELKIRFRKTGEKIYEVGERIAQLTILPCPKIKFVQVDELSKTQRGEKSYGSTGN